MNIKRIPNYLAIGSGLLLVGIGTALVLPIAGDDASATCSSGDTTEGCVSAQADLEAEVTVGTSIAVGMDSKVSLDLIPTASGTIDTYTTKLNVSTNSVEGYALYIKGDEALLDTTSVNSTATTDSIAALGKSAILSEEDFPMNTYAYYLGSSDNPKNVTYPAVDTTGTRPIIKTSTSTNPSTSTSTSPSPSSSTSGDSDYAYGDSYDLTFGVKIGTTLPAGTYAGKVTISAVANPTTIKSMVTLTYMQDMTSSICEHTREGYTKRLTDTRDGKLYWVAKLADGNCWMTQNLALDITAEGLSASDTNISEDWNASSAHCQDLPTGTYCVPTTTETTIPKNTYTSQIITRSWDFGNWLFVDSEVATPCISTTTGEGDLSTCSYIGLINVSDAEWKPTFTATQGSWTGPTQGEDASKLENNGITTTIGSGNTLISVDTQNKTYDPHYLIGNYYQFNTATAGYGGVRRLTEAELASSKYDKDNNTYDGMTVYSGSDDSSKWVGVQNTNVEYSICPKNWKLPISGTKDKSGSFYNMLSKYNLQNSVSGKVDEVPYNITSSPLYFVRSGFVYLPEGSLGYFGIGGYSWSRSSAAYNSFSSATANGFNFNVSNVDSLGSASNRRHGFPIRCIAE